MEHKQKIFILFSGELRFFNENLLSINRYLKEFEKIFLFYPWSQEINKIENFKKTYPNSNFDYISQKNWDKSLEQIKYSDNAARIPSIFYMWDALTQSFSKIINNLDENDLVLRFRTDIKIHTTNLNINLKNIKDNTIYIPDCYHWNGYNDQVFLSKVKTLKKFKNFFEVLELLIKNNNFISPEYVFYKFIKKKKIEIIFFELDYQILRKNRKLLNNRELNIRDKKSYIPIKDKIIIKTLKFLFKMRNFRAFFIKKIKRDKRQNLFDE